MLRSAIGRSAMFAVAAASTLLLAACGASADAASNPAASSDAKAPSELVFAQIPSESASGIAADNATIIKVLQDKLGIPVKLQEATDYAAVIEGLRAGKVQVAGLGPFSYVTAKDGGAGVEPLGALVDSKEEKPGYKSYGLVPKGSPIKDLAGFKGKKVCFVDPTSTSGYLYPSAGLLKLGIDPKKDVTPVMAGGHDASVLSIIDGTCDAGFAYDTMVTKELVESGQIKGDEVTKVWESDTIPGSPYGVSTQLPKDLQDKIKDVFANDLNVPWLVDNGYCTDAKDCHLPEDSKYGFVPVDDQLYDGIRQVCDVTKADACVS